MRAAAKTAVLALALAAAACGGAEQQEPPPPGADNAAGADIEALPADESAATSSEELANGVNDPDAADLGNQH